MTYVCSKVDVLFCYSVYIWSVSIRKDNFGKHPCRTGDKSATKSSNSQSSFAKKMISLNRMLLLKPRSKVALLYNFHIVVVEKFTKETSLIGNIWKVALAQKLQSHFMCNRQLFTSTVKMHPPLFRSIFGWTFGILPWNFYYQIARKIRNRKFLLSNCQKNSA